MESIVNKIRRLGPKMAFQKAVGYEAVFTCGIREKNGAALYEGNMDEPFYIMPYSKEYWYADPLLYEFSGELFLYMEAFDKKKKKGCIACSRILDGKIGEAKTIIEEPYHMSFPMIYKMGNEVYMIPETEAGGTINIYINNDDPCKWTLFQRIETEMSIVDSVVYDSSIDTVSIIASTFCPNNPKLTRYILYQLRKEHDRFSICFDDKFNSSSQYGYGNRNSGYIIGDLHCTQRSTPAVYGYANVFYRLKGFKEGTLDETFMSEITPNQIKMISDKRIKPIGIHTYSLAGNYEAIDLEYLEFNPGKWI